MTFAFTFPENLFYFGLIAIIASLIISPIALKLAYRFNLIDHPGSSAHKQHAKPTALAGGTALYLGLLLLFALFGLWRNEHLRIIFFAATIIYLFGLWDDHKGLSALPKLFGQITATILLITFDVSVQFMESIQLPFVTAEVARLFDYGITLLWLVGVTNAMNMIDSMDGLAIGVSSIAFLFFVPVTLSSGQIYLAELSIILLGLSTGLYYFNITPAKFFLGDSGAQTLGFLVGAIAMIYTPQGQEQASSWFVPILLAGIPIFDTTLVVYSRLRRGSPIYRANLDHIYHRLISFGLDSRRSVLAVHLASILTSLLAFIALFSEPIVANAIFTAIIFSGLGLIIWLEHKRGKAP